ncbi:unnamed protein product, partial [Adineta steineri]
SPPRIISSNKDPSTDQQMSRVNAIVAQPGRHVWRFEHLWSHPLYSCCTDLKQCCYAFFCPWCYECNLFDRAGENLWTCICPGARYALRSKIRTAFRIENYKRVHILFDYEYLCQFNLIKHASVNPDIKCEKFAF